MTRCPAGQTAASTSHLSRPPPQQRALECRPVLVKPRHIRRTTKATGCWRAEALVRVITAPAEGRSTTAGLEGARHVYTISARERGCILPGSAMKKMLWSAVVTL